MSFLILRNFRVIQRRQESEKADSDPAYEVASEVAKHLHGGVAERVVELESTSEKEEVVSELLKKVDLE